MKVKKIGQYVEEYFNLVILNAGGVNNLLELRSVKMDGFFNRDNKLAQILILVSGHTSALLI